MTTDKEDISNIIPVEAVQERDTDLLILEEIKCNRNFTDWLVRKTIGLQDNYELIGAWHSLTQVGLGESDLEVVIRIDKKRILFLIENKVDADFQPDQANRYRLRGKQKKDNGECDEYYSILFAPNRYLAPKNDFDVHLKYEEVRDWFLNQTDLGLRAKYKADILDLAIERQRRGYSPIINEAVTDFRWAYYNYTEKNFPYLKMNRPNPGMPKKTGFIRFRPTDMGLRKGDFIIHKKWGAIDLQLGGKGDQVETLKERYKNVLTEEMEVVKTVKSASIRIRVPKVDIEGSFNNQLANIDIALSKVETLYEWGKANL